jgi:hypothetical protein
MFSYPTSMRRKRPQSVTPLASAFSDRVNRQHPLGNLLAVFSTITGVILVLAVSL